MKLVRFLFIVGLLATLKPFVKGYDAGNIF